MNREIQAYIQEQIQNAFTSRMDKAFLKAAKKYPLLAEMLEADIFYPNIPEADHNPSDDQPLMKLNNQKIANQWGANHIGITETSNSGLHTRLDLKNFNQQQSQVSGFGLIYFLNNVLKIWDPLGREVKVQSEASMGSGGYIRIPASTQSVLLQAGKDGGRNGKVVGFPTPFSQIPVVLVVPRRGNAKAMWIVDGSENLTQFTVGMDGGTSNFNWIAIGT